MLIIVTLSQYTQKLRFLFFLVQHEWELLSPYIAAVQKSGCMVLTLYVFCET